MIKEYLSGWAGILNRGQYLYLFLLSFNPALFRLFKWRHFLFLVPGVFLSIFNHRAVMPFLLLIILDLDYSKTTKEFRQHLLYYAMAATAIISIFGGGA